MTSQAPDDPSTRESAVYRRRDWISVGGAGSALSSVGLLLYLLNQVGINASLLESQGKTLAALAEGVSTMQAQQTAMHGEMDATRREIDGRLSACELRGLAQATRLDDIERGLAECREAVKAVDARRRDDRAATLRRVNDRLRAAGVAPGEQAPAVAGGTTQ